MKNSLDAIVIGAAGYNAALADAGFGGWGLMARSRYISLTCLLRFS